MTIDPNSFEAQGKPTIDQVREVWDRLGRPGHRRVHEELEKRGFQISARTVARYMLNFVPQATLSETVNRIAKEERKEAVSTNEDNQAKGMRLKGIVPAILDKDASQQEVDIIDQRITELALKSSAELDHIEQKARKILNIVLMESAARRGHIMVLIPKETGAFVNSMTDASRQALTGGEGQPPAADDPRVVDGTVVDNEPPSELQSAIDRYLKSEELA